MKKRRVAVIGVGSMGSNHVRVYSELPRVTTVAISDVNERLGKEVARTYQTKWYQSYEELYEKERPDAVSIVTPTKYHYPVAAFFLSKKVDVLLEKPITQTAIEGKKLISMAEKFGSFFTVGHIERFNPAVIVVKKLVEAKRIGEVIAISAQRIGLLSHTTAECDVLLDIGIHDVDIANYILKSYPRKVTVHKSYNAKTKSIGSAEVLMEYSKAAVLIQTNWLTPVKVRQLTITGTHGYITLDYIRQKVSLYEQPKTRNKTRGDFITILLLESAITDIPVKKQEPLKEEISAFLKHSANCMDPTDALKALQICTKKVNQGGI